MDEGIRPVIEKHPLLWLNEFNKDEFCKIYTQPVRELEREMKRHCGEKILAKDGKATYNQENKV